MESTARIFCTALSAAFCFACGNNSGDGQGSFDSGVPDAGNSDAGSADAGPDAGPRDAGASDAGAADAGASDAGASDAGAADAGPFDAGAPILTGVLMAGPGPAPGAYAGVQYSAGAQTGYTDSNGAFHYPTGSQIAFSVGGLQLGAVAGAARITPFTLSGGCAITPQLTSLLVLLQSLDQDLDPTNGIQISQFPNSLSGTLAGLTSSQLAADIAQLMPGRVPVSNQSALDLFIAQVDGESWALVSMDTFSLLSGGERSQGGASDGTSWFFSWRFGLQRTDASYSLQKQNLAAIPPLLALQGSDHIGDIDYSQQTIYAGIEDSAHYSHPYIALFDSTSLSYKSSYPLEASVQSQGVPWVAYDGAKDLAYSSLWSPSPGINIFDGFNSMAFLRTIALSPALNRIQGAKLYRGFLYAVVDESQKVVYKINLDTGTALPVLSMDLGSVEQEGIIFQERSDGSAMHTLNANSGTTGIDFRHQQRTRAPLRDSICP